MTDGDSASLDSIHLEAGSHPPDSHYCVMELSAKLAGEPWSDHPGCVSPVIAAFLRSWNDSSEDEFRQRLKPYARRVIGTKTHRRYELTRSWLAVDWLLREYSPTWLDAAAGLPEHAHALRALPALDSVSWKSSAAAPTVTRASAAAWTVYDAATLRAPFGSDAAWTAFVTASFATRWAVSAAARTVPNATLGAASDAADTAALAAFEAATRAVLRSTLLPTVTVLQASAFGLLDRMIAVGTPRAHPPQSA